MPDDVQPGPSPDPQLPADGVTADSPPVTGDGGGDRPIENVKAEFDRKYSGLQQMVEGIALAVAQMASQRQMPPQVVSGTQGVPTDQELLEAARAGNADAGVALNQRIAQREVEARMQFEKQAQNSQSRILQLANTYPDFQNPQSELFAAARAEKNSLIQQGWHPQSWDTTLTAMQNAVLNNPQMVRASSTVGELNRQSAVSAGQAPRASGRSGGPAKPATQELSPEALALSKRMGVKDPVGALKRFKERQAAGRSEISPLIETILTRQEG